MENGKIRVYGKAQNRTALGIVQAYLVMYPHATLADLKQAFPNALNPDKGVKENFISEEEIKSRQDSNWNGYFIKEDELLPLGDGTKAALVSMWTKNSFDRLVSHAGQYGIEIASFDSAEKGFGKRGSYRLEYLNGYIPPKPEAPKKSTWWIWAIIVVVLAIIAAFFIFRKPAVIEKTKVVKVVDTVYVKQIEQIEKNFNAAQFAQGKSDLTEKAKVVLDDLASFLTNNPTVKLKIVGHTSSEGSDDLNQKLSEARAKAAVDYLVSKGIDNARLQYEGKGSKEIIDSNNPETNRRTEFIIIK